MEKAETISVVRTECFRGEGTEKNPMRKVTQYWSSDGKLLFEKDPFDSKFPDVGDCPFVIRSNGIRGQVVKDGVDITRGIKSVNIVLEAGKIPKVTVERIETEMEISICDCMYKENQPNQAETAER